MHKYLRAIGFASVKNRKDIELLIKDVVGEAADREYTSLDEDNMLAVYRKEYAPGIGMTVVGEYNENNQFFYEYSYPYVNGSVTRYYENISVERHSDKESYAGICEEDRMGINLIFYLQNIISYLKMKNVNMLRTDTDVTFSALSVDGTIVLPLLKDAVDIEKINRFKKYRSNLFEQAKNGNPQAMESLALEDMDTYSVISKKLRDNDIFTIVDTYFMPCGIECDQYSVMGEILEVESCTNYYTGEEIYLMKLNCNEIVVDMAINKKDLYGEPVKGRRFKGVIWLQGHIALE